MQKDIKYIHTKIKQVFNLKETNDITSIMGHYQSFASKDLYCNLKIDNEVATIELNKANQEKFSFVVGLGKKWSKSDIILLKQHKNALIKKVESRETLRLEYRPNMFE